MHATHTTSSDTPVWMRSSDGILLAAAAVERGVVHPLAHAVLAAADRQLVPQELASLNATGHQTVAGLGATAFVGLGDQGEQRIEIGVGSRRFFAEQPNAVIPDEVESILQNANTRGHTCMLVAANKVVS